MAVIKLSMQPSEWYCSYQKCVFCKTEFMCSNPKFCPGCGEKIEKVIKSFDMRDFDKESEDGKNERI